MSAGALLSFEESLQAMASRLHSVEMRVNSTGVVGGGEGGTGSNEFETVVLGPPGSQIALSVDPPETPTGLTATVGSFYETIYVDLSWTPAATGEFAAEYEVEIAKKISGVYQTEHVERTVGTSFRKEPLEADTTYGFRVTPVSRLGILGPASAWVDFTTSHDSTLPPAVTGVVVTPTATGLVVTFNRLTALQAPDVEPAKGLYEVEISNNGFTSVFATKRTTSNVEIFGNINTSATWVARVRAIDSSGNAGATSAVSASTTAGGITTGMVLDSAINSNKIAAGAITANKLAVIIGGGNLAPNSGFEDSTLPGTASYSAGTIASSTNPVRTGARAVSVSSTTAWGGAYLTPHIPVAHLVGQSVIGSGYLNTPGAGPAIAVQMYDSTAAVVATSSFGTASVNGSWSRAVAGTLVVPSTATTMRLLTFSSAAASTWSVDDIQIEVGEVATGYAPKTDEILPGTIVASMIAAGTITGDRIAAGTITGDRIAALTITGDRIAGNTIHGNSITTNTLSAAKLTTSILTSANIIINGGSLKAGDPPTTGVLFDASGIKLYGGGNVTVDLNAATGNGTFRGNVDAATITGSSFTATGSTVVIGSAGGIKFSQPDFFAWDQNRGLRWDSTDPSYLGTMFRLWSFQNEGIVQAPHATSYLGLWANQFGFSDQGGGNNRLTYGAALNRWTSGWDAEWIFQGPVTIDTSGDVSTSNDGDAGLTIGPPGFPNIGIDGNEIQARDMYAASRLHLNHGGGAVTVNAGDLAGMASTANAANMRWGTSDGILYKSTSSLRGKTVQNVSKKEVRRFGASMIRDLSPMRFKSNHPADDDRDFFGLGAEDVHDVWPEAVSLDQNGEPDGIDWNFITAALVAMNQEQDEEIAGLRSRIEALEAA